MDRLLQPSPPASGAGHENPRRGIRISGLTCADSAGSIHDGEPGEPEVTLSPLRYHYQHRAEIEAVVQSADRDTTFATLCASIGAAISTDRTLGGRCDWVEAEAPRPVDLPVDGAASLKAAVIPVILHYSTGDPLG
ncbi:acyl-CoA transferase (plasmid) [Cereibacter azotoformans]|uniref:acyl-CoA transferase n=1 Tax=Cereibacter azotoformans TaxID=43057 RepID=UPI003B226DEA